MKIKNTPPWAKLHKANQKTGLTMFPGRTGLNTVAKFLITALLALINLENSFAQQSVTLNLDNADFAEQSYSSNGITAAFSSDGWSGGLRSYYWSAPRKRNQML